jgi:exopolysaccharide production protein ExoQ
MPRQLAILLCVSFVLWLFAMERKGRMQLSAALWLPVAWMTILGSRPVSVWLGMNAMEDTGDAIEGSPLDRLLFQMLIVAACLVLVRRQINWRVVFTTNRWVMLYFVYLGFSVLWSDFPMTALKRWVKDAGSVLMVLVILTEASPLQALKTTLLRCAYVLVPFSVLFIKYVPELGRGYDPWTYEPINIGVTTNKNMLGMSLFVCGLSLLWALVDKWEERLAGPKWTRMTSDFVLAFMVLYLLQQTHSATAVACTVLGSGVFFATRVAAIRRKLERAAVFVLAAAVLLVTVGPMIGLDKALVGLLGRDLTFTGRTDIWKAVLAETTNPLIGAGHYSFWLGDRVERISQSFFYHLNEAHNGFLEVYLNAGLIGLTLLLVVLVSCWKKSIKEVLTGDSLAGFRLAVLAGTIVYGITEAVFRFGFVSAALIAVVMADSSWLGASVSEATPILVADEECHSVARGRN